MFVLTNNFSEYYDVKGVFTDIKEAQKYVSEVMNREHLTWSQPGMDGSIWANSNGGTLYLWPVELNPTA